MNYRNTQTVDPITMNNTKNMHNKNERLFIFVQNGMRYKFLLNSMLQLYAREGNKIKNPLTRKQLNAKTINRLSEIEYSMIKNARKRYLKQIKTNNSYKDSNNENSNFN